MPHAGDRDLETMTRIARGEERALTELLERHGPVVFGLARRITGDQQIAEEVLQDSFLRVAREAANYRPSPSGVAPWLLRIARNASIDAIRRRKREKRVGSGGDPGVLDGVADARASESSEGVALDEFGSAVRVALGELPQGPRKALDLAYFNGLTHSEIAEKLQVPLGTAKTWVRTGLQTLRERLARFIEPGRSS